MKKTEMPEEIKHFSNLLVQKKQRIVKACRLGNADPAIDSLIRERKLIDRGNGVYEVFSQEAVRAKAMHGETAHAGDYIKIDSRGFPYPNTSEFFHQNYRHIGNNLYETIPVVLHAWTSSMPVSMEVKFLISKKGLVLNPGDPQHYFSATLYGTKESADIHAVLIFYRIDHDKQGNITDIEFNFVARDEFDRTYDILD